MTREELVKIIAEDCGAYLHHSTEDAADRILAALEKEREGEVVLGDGEYGLILHRLYCHVKDGISPHDGKQGQLIFRATKAKEAGK